MGTYEMTQYEHPAVIETIVLHTVWTNCPTEVKEEIAKLWEEREYGNDYTYHEFDWDEDSNDLPKTTLYLLKELGLTYVERKQAKPILINYWW